MIDQLALGLFELGLGVGPAAGGDFTETHRDNDLLELGDKARIFLCLNQLFLKSGDNLLAVMSTAIMRGAGAGCRFDVIGGIGLRLGGWAVSTSAPSFRLARLAGRDLGVGGVWPSFRFFYLYLLP